MPRALPVPLRRVLWRRSQRGQSAAVIAAALGLSVRTVRHLLRRFGDSATTLTPSYPRDTRHLPPQQEIFQAAVQLRQQHPGWGAGLIRVLLARDRPAATLPTERTMQRWFRQAGLGPAPRGRRPQRESPRAQRPHQVWQVDAAEQVRLASKGRVSWLRISDEYSGAILRTTVFPPRLLGAGRGPGRAGRVPAGVWPLGFARADALR